MSQLSRRSALVLGALFTRRGRTATRTLAAAVGAVMALSLSGLFGLVHFITQVGDQGRQRDLGMYVEGGCVQGSYRYDPIGLEQYPKHLLASTCDAPPVPPGLSSFPRPGEVFLSPALASLRQHDDRIAARFPRLDGQIDRSGLVSSNELLAVVGVQPVSGPLPAGVTTFDDFGSDADYLATHLRFNRTTLLVIGLFFTLLPGGYLIAACTRLNARTRQRQIDLLSIIGTDQTTVRRALAVEATWTVGVGAVVGVLLARPLLARATPTFVGWTAFPGDFSPGPLTMPVVLALVIGLAGASASLAARVLHRRGGRRQTRVLRMPVPWRWALLGAGLAAAVITHWWHEDAAWPLVLGGRLCTFIGLLLVTPPVCAHLGARLSASDRPLTALAGARLRRPSGGLTRALAAVTSGLFVLSAGATSINALGADPAGLQQAYAPDGISVVEVRRPSEAVRAALRRGDVLTGTNASDSPEVAGTLRGSCAAVRAVTGGQVPCTTVTHFYGISYQGQRPPAAITARPLALIGPRAEALSGFVITITDRAVVDGRDDNVFVPLSATEAGRLYDRLVGLDASVNVRIAGSATISGASELDTILDVFRWGAGFAVLASLLAALISLVALLYDRQPANNYVQILGVTRREAARAALTEVIAAAAGTVALAFACSVLWAFSYGEATTLASLLDVAAPFIAVLLLLTAATAVVIWTTLRQAAVSIVPDRDGLVSAQDVFEPLQAGSRR